MKIKFVWGILPVIITKSKNTWGHARAFFVKLPDNHGKPMYEHELFHVKQFYAMLFLYVTTVSAMIYGLNYLDLRQDVSFGISMLTSAAMIWMYLNDWMKFRKETAAYGESLRNIKPSDRESVARHYARVLSSSENYDLEITYEEALEKILKRQEDGRLF